MRSGSVSFALKFCAMYETRFCLFCSQSLCHLWTMFCPILQQCACHMRNQVLPLYRHFMCHVRDHALLVLPCIACVTYGTLLLAYVEDCHARDKVLLSLLAECVPCMGRFGSKLTIYRAIIRVIGGAMEVIS
jgi:hypothetical protein